MQYFHSQNGELGDLGEFCPIVAPIKCSTFASLCPPCHKSIWLSISSVMGGDHIYTIHNMCIVYILRPYIYIIHKVISFVRRLLDIRLIKQRTNDLLLYSESFSVIHNICIVCTLRPYIRNIRDHSTWSAESQVEEQFGIKDFCNKKIFNCLGDEIYSQEQFINKQSENHADLERVCEETNQILWYLKTAVLSRVHWQICLTRW